MEKKNPLLRLGAFGALLTVTAIVAVSVMAMAVDMDYLKLIGRYFAGYQPLPLQQFITCTDLFRVSLIFDFFLISGQILAWLGLSTLLGRKYPRVFTYVIIIGILGPVLDFVQNSMEWALITGIELNVSVQPSWFFGWTVVTQLSFLLTFAGSFACSFMLYESKVLNRLFTAIGTILIVPAVLGLYFSRLCILSLIWYLLWYLCASLLLLKEKREPVNQVP
ncbi:MAG: hypothetical protein JW874_04810 [Spirochaetales bacterium]|nr:hypothetical protein [Spirochaetales bacterium]